MHGGKELRIEQDADGARPLQSCIGLNEQDDVDLDVLRVVPAAILDLLQERADNSGKRIG